MPADVTIIIPTYQGSRWLKDTLPAIRRQTYAGRVDILAVDSSSTDGTADLLQQHGATVITIPQSDFTHGYARNLAVKHAKTDVVVFMSQDVLPVGEDWLAGLVALLDAHEVGAAYVRQLPRPNATALESFFHQEMYPPQNRRFAMEPGATVTLDKIFFSNVCSVARRDLCLRFPFPEDLIMSEDQAFAKALLQAGYQTYYSADVTVIHSHHYGLRELFSRNFDSAYSLKGIAHDTLSSTASAGIRFIAREARYLIKQRRWLSLPYMVLYELARISGRLLGGQADRLPQWLRVRLSMHSGFWTNTLSTNNASTVE